MAVLLSAIILFVTGKLRVDLVALCVLAVLLGAGIIAVFMIPIFWSF